MELMLDLKKFKRIINAIPEKKHELDEETEGFKHLYQTVYLPLSSYDADGDEPIRLNVDISKFDSDDLLKFYDFISSKCNGNINSPLSKLDTIISKLPPLSRKQIFI